MKPKKTIPIIFFLSICLLFTQCEKEEIVLQGESGQALKTNALHPGSMKGPPEGKGPKEETASNNLSYPVIWAEGVAKTLPGAPGMVPLLNGEWWYQWGTNGVDPDIMPASCPPDPDAGDPVLNPLGLPLCDDGVEGSVDFNLIAGDPPADNPMDLAKAFLQKDQMNTWQAGSFDSEIYPVNVDWIDWGDNLESVDWYTRSQVRTEVVLFEDDVDGDVETYPWPMLEYEMRHTDGWGINEVHGLAASPAESPDAYIGPGTRATIYSHCARFTIQKLNVLREHPDLTNLYWVPEQGWEGSVGYEDLINTPIFNKSVHEGGDGPGYYSAEINVKGRIIYGYTWNVRNLNEGAGDYRLTFSFDASDGAGNDLNTFFIQGTTNILVPLEEELLIAAAEEGEEPGGGGSAVFVPYDPIEGTGNLTYMDIRIIDRGGGGGGGNGGGNGGGHK